MLPGQTESTAAVVQYAELNIRLSFRVKEAVHRTLQ